MKRRKFFLCAVTCYNLLMSLLLLYVIATSLAFTCEYLFGAVPAGSMYVFSLVGAVFAVKTFIERMCIVQHTAECLSLESNQDIVSACIVIAGGISFFLVLAWVWIKIYPYI